MKKYFLIFTIVLILILSTIVVVYILNWEHRFANRSRASGADFVSVTFQPEQTTVTTGQQFSIDVYMSTNQNPNLAVTGIDLTVSYDPIKLEVISITEASPNFLTVSGINPSPDIIKSGSVASTTASIALTTGPTKTGVSGFGKVVQLSVKAKDITGLTTLSVSSNTIVSVVSMDTNAIQTPLSSSSITIGTLTPIPSTTPACSGYTYFDGDPPDNSILTVGSTVHLRGWGRICEGPAGKGVRDRVDIHRCDQGTLANCIGITGNIPSEHRQDLVGGNYCGIDPNPNTDGWYYDWVVPDTPGSFALRTAVVNDSASTCMIWSQKNVTIGNPLSIFKVFVSSLTYKGNLGGLSGADSKCQGLATAAGLTGTYKAWLSTSSVNAKDRITDGQYVKTDGIIVANSKADIIDGTILAKINKTESGSVVDENSSWTGTKSDGIKKTNYCGTWNRSSSSKNGDTGLNSEQDTKWTQYSQSSCNKYMRLYCFQTGS